MKPTNTTDNLTLHQHQVVRDMGDLSFVIDNGLLPISNTAPYFAETFDKDAIHIITGAADSFWYDPIKDGDNRWVKELSKKYNTPKKARKRVAQELKSLENCFAKAGFNNFHYLPANVQGMINWIFLNNAMAAGFDHEGTSSIYFGNMKNDNRKPEPSLVEFYLTGCGDVIPKLTKDMRIERAQQREFNMEGKGDQLPMSLPVLVDGKPTGQFYHAIINCSGRRTDPKALEEFAARTGNYVIDVPLSDDPITGAYHGNVAIFYFQQKDGIRGVTYVPDMLEEGKRNFVSNMFNTFFGKDNVHAITGKHGALYKECIENITMNVINVGPGSMIASTRNPETNKFLERELGMEILGVDMDGIALGGGGLQCCYTALNKNHLEMARYAKYL